MKTTLDIKDELLTSARKQAKRSGRPLRSVVEEGLQLVLSQQREQRAFRLQDCSVGDPDRPDPLESWTWQDLRDEIYGESSRQCSRSIPTCSSTPTVANPATTRPAPH